MTTLIVLLRPETPVSPEGAMRAGIVLGVFAVVYIFLVLWSLR